MIQIPDDPIVSSLLRTGLPPWLQDAPEEPEEDQDPREAALAAILSNLEAYGYPAGPALYELPSKGGTTHAELR